MGKRYVFVGEGAGVPGLPHEITDEQAKAGGLEELLRAAIANGTYQEVRPPKGIKTQAEESD